jgi:hypothetical protein
MWARRVMHAVSLTQLGARDRRSALQIHGLTLDLEAGDMERVSQREAHGLHPLWYQISSKSQISMTWWLALDSMQWHSIQVDRALLCSAAVISLCTPVRIEIRTRESTQAVVIQGTIWSNDRDGSVVVGHWKDSTGKGPRGGGSKNVFPIRF